MTMATNLLVPGGSIARPQYIHRVFAPRKNSADRYRELDALLDGGIVIYRELDHRKDKDLEWKV
jgi:hypothetical protein